MLQFAIDDERIRSLLSACAVIDKSKQDPQYGMGIQEQARPSNLVDSKEYWEQRYAMGGNSGAGSYNKIATFKVR
jgi:hypothetical protein